MANSPSIGVPSYVPDQYKSYVQSAASQLGISPDIVAAQIKLESDFNPNAVSGAGAEGIAQFEPGTFSSYGTGSPYNVKDAFAAYVNYMKSLLKDEGGDIRKALEAYNAGPGNLSAGSGYASTILSNAGVTGQPTASGGASTSATDASAVSSLLGFPSSIVKFFKEGVTAIEDSVSFFEVIFSPQTYVRVGAGFFGVIFIIITLILLYKESK